MRNLHFCARRQWLVAAAVTAMSAFGGCASVGTVTLSAQEIERLIERSFPLDRNVSDLFDATVQAPKLTLLPDRNRLAATIDVAVRQRLLGLRWNGRIGFDSALRWEPTDQSLRLSQVRVQDVAFDTASGATRSTAERLAAALAERVLEDMVLYRLSAERAADLSQRYGRTPSAVTVTSRGVEITFAPAAR